MRTLIYVPIIHTNADLGSLAEDMTKRAIADLGEELWWRHRKTVDVFWNVISNYFDSMNIEDVKVYQDGMMTEGEVARAIVDEGVKSGSKNYKLVSKLLSKGAILVKTEDFNLVKKERDKLQALIQKKPIINKLFAYARYTLTKDRLLRKRDKFIAKSIDKTLCHGEKGILFIGAYHNIKKWLPKSIQIIEVKDVEKVRKYHKLLPFYKKNRERFKSIETYLVSNIAV